MAEPPPTVDNQASGEQQPFSFDVLHQSELSTIAGSDHDVVVEGLRKSTWGIALSGGGIRSATFSLGVLQTLAEKGLLKGFHYLSTVSGGGYIGGLLQNLIARHGVDASIEALNASVDDQRPVGDSSLPANRVVRHLREYSNYLSPRPGVLGGDSLSMISTYFRNLILVQIQLFSFMIFLGVLPLLLHYAGSELLGDQRLLILAIGMAAIAACLLAVLSDRARLHGKGTGNATLKWVPAIANLVTLLLAFASLVAAVGLARLTDVASFFGLCAWVNLDPLSQTCQNLNLAGWIASVYAATWLAWLAFEILIDGLRPSDNKPIVRHWWRYLSGTVLTSIIGAVLLVCLYRWIQTSQLQSVWSYIVIVTPLAALTVVITASIHLGLVGPAMTDLQREVWARIGGRSMAYILVGVCGSVGLLIYGPWWLSNLTARGEISTQGAAWFGIFSWAATTIGGVLASYRKLNIGPGLRARLASMLVSLAPWIFVLGLWVLIGFLVQRLLVLAGWSELPFLVHAQELSSYLKSIAKQTLLYPGALFAVSCISITIWFIFGMAVDANDCSMNAFYRNRLVRCYLGAGNDDRRPEGITGFDPKDDRKLSQLADSDGTRPLYPLIGSALNLVKSGDLDWQDRKAASFLMSPLYCGHMPPPGRKTQRPVGDRGLHDEHRLSDQLTLGSAMAISGAAVNSNMGALSSPAVTFLLTLFDARLGWWLPNRNARSPLHPAHTGFSGLVLLYEMLGLTHSEGKLVHVSDGGHFENLALYELIRRRCQLVICVDAGADPDRHFSDLGNAVHKCRVDFGVDIQIDVNSMKPGKTGRHSERQVAIGQIHYPEPDAEPGLLIYIKPTLRGDEPADVAHYAEANADFPHESTGDQYFNEAQFESYRRLGKHIADGVLEPVLERLAGAADDFARDPLTPSNKEAIRRELAHHWYKPLPTADSAFSRYGNCMAKLFSVLRKDERLKTLEAQLYPSWKYIASDMGLIQAANGKGDLHKRLPATDELRASFFFCQELIQLMELVYQDLQLEEHWSHPDNRRWMNSFKHWTWVPMFRLTWVLSAQTYGARFASFCETRLDAPSYEPNLKVEKVQISTAGIAETADDLYAQQRINFAERSALRSAAFAQMDAPNSVFLLTYRWKRDSLLSAQTDLSDLTLGIATVSNAEKITLFRVQDHMRGMGLGTRFMQLLLSQQKVKEAVVAPGHYGDIGVVTATKARRVEEQINRLLHRQQLRQRLETIAANNRTNHQGE